MAESKPKRAGAGKLSANATTETNPATNPQVIWPSILFVDDFGSTIMKKPKNACESANDNNDVASIATPDRTFRSKLKSTNEPKKENEAGNLIMR